tara:strand:+ start:4424 stop:5002 length:579 start_codon:yes stop_codon:yes gene_type:complete
MKLKKVGMNLIRVLLISVIITGCISNKQMINFDENQVIGSYIKDNLFNVNYLVDSKEIWRNSEEYALFIQHGKVYKTLGLKNNLELLNAYPIKIDYLKENNEYKSSSQILFSNPKTNYLDIFFKYKLVSNKDIFNISSSSLFIIVEESFNIPLIKWKGKNYYLIENNEVIESIQNLTPFTKAIQIKHKKIAT